MPEEISDGLYVRQLIWGKFPNHRGAILALERDHRDLMGDLDAEVGPYSLVSQIFVEGILLPALEVPEVFTLRESADLIETLLSSDRAAVPEMASIRVTDYLLGFPETWFKFREFAGPNLVEDVKQMSRYYTFDPFIPLGSGDE
ncbi:hypothetical protein ACWGI1_13125 [Streptomyces sp. NPDC054835]|uniref:hypothetical protein n=1 Tax=Streptomyces sp. NBC_01268 TaxID=2903806 RepID=UPI002E31AB7F|nr:hypothetical protein [Streptomyces sp. NBC_01268]